MQSFRNRLLIGVGILACVAIAATGITSVVGYKPWGVPDVRRDEYDLALAKIRREQAIKNSPRPIASVELLQEPEGLVAANSDVVFTFKLSNLGNRELSLDTNDSMASDLQVQALPEVLQPRSSAEFKVAWTVSADAEGEQVRQLKLKTNDPLNETIDALMTARVATPLAATIKQVSASADPGENAVGKTIIYSQTTDLLALTETESGGRVLVSSKPVADEQLLEKWDAKSAIVLTFRHPPLDRVRKFQDVVTATFLVDDEERTLSFDFSGRFRPAIGFYGPELDVRGGLHLGVVPVGSDTTWSFLARFRGDEVPSSAIIKDVKPDGLKATIEKVDSNPGDYRVTVSVRDNAKPVNFQVMDQGFVEVASSDDPTLSNWLPLHGYIIAAESGSP